MSADAVAVVPSMDPSLEALIRSVNLCDQSITVFRVQEITDRELFVALDTLEESLRETCEEAFGVESSNSLTRENWAKLF